MNAIAFKCIFSQYDQKSVSRLFIAILLHSVVEYSLNQFPCHRHVFSWKPWINKLRVVTLCSHDHFQFEFHLISQIFYSIDPEHFQGKFAFRKSGRIDFSQFSSLWMLMWVFIPTSCPHRFTLGFPYTSRETHLHCSARLLFPPWGNYFEYIQSLKMHLISVESDKICQNASKIYQTHFAFNCQLPT